MQEGVDHLTLAQAAKLAPGRPSTCCIWRWCRTGIKSRGGERIRLHHVRCGGRLFTSKVALEAFFDAVAQADREHFDRSPAPVPSVPTNRQRERSQQAAEQVLRAGGIVS